MSSFSQATLIGYGRVPYPLDVFSGPDADMAWGPFVWTRSAVGQSIVTDSSSTAYTGGEKFASGTFTGQRVKDLHAQVGSAAWTQATAANQPTIWASETDGWPEIRWQSRLGTAGSKNMTVVSAPSTRSRDWTFVSIERGAPETYGASGSNQDQLFGLDHLCASLGGADLFGITGSVSAGSWSANNRIFRGTGGWTDTNAVDQPSCKFYVRVVRYNSSGTTIWVDGVKNAIASSTVTATAVAPSDLGKLNGFAIYTDGVASLGGAWFPALSDAEVTEITNLIHLRLYGATPSALWYFDGDSITAGYSTTDSNLDIRHKSWPWLLINSALTSAQRAKVVGVNVAHTAAHLETQTNAAHKLMTNQAGKVNAHVASGRGYSNRVVVLCAGTNDIEFGTTDETLILAKLVDYKDAAELAGATRVLICTQIPRQGFDSTKNATLAALNSAILTEFGSDAIDVAAENWQPGGGSDWSTNYQDGIHPNAAGRQLFVDAILSTMTGLL